MAAAEDEQSVNDVEDWALAHKLEVFFRKPMPFETQMKSAAWWPLPLATAWRLTQHPDEAITEWVRQKNWGRDLWRTAAWHGAQEEIWRCLQAGQLVAKGIRDLVPAHVSIDAIEWHTLTWERYGQVDLISRNYNHRAAYLDVLVDAKLVKKVWPERTEADRRRQTTAAAQLRCRRDLEEQMRASPSAAIPKSELRAKFPDVGRNAFNRAFHEAVKATGSSWDKAGRRPKSIHL